MLQSKAEKEKAEEAQKDSGYTSNQAGVSQRKSRFKNSFYTISQQHTTAALSNVLHTLYFLLTLRMLGSIAILWPFIQDANTQRRFGFSEPETSQFRVDPNSHNKLNVEVNSHVGSSFVYHFCLMVCLTD